MVPKHPLTISARAFFPFLILLLVFRPIPTALAVTNHIVISEIQVTGGTGFTDEEFIELYNPTAAAVDVTGWKMVKKARGSTNEISLITFSASSIPARGFFLIAPQIASFANVADAMYPGNGSAVISNDNTIVLLDANNQLIDKVGMGKADDKENEAALLPTAKQSIERKAVATSDTASMTLGADMYEGNGYDSDNNHNDFIIRLLPQPQNKQSPPEPNASPTSTPAASPFPSALASSSPQTTPSGEPSLSPTPMASPTTPSVSPNPSPSWNPTTTPTSSSSPQLRPIFRGSHLVCQVSMRQILLGHVQIRLPTFSCQRY